MAIEPSEFAMFYSAQLLLCLLYIYYIEDAVWKNYGNNNFLRKDKPSLRCHLRSMDKTYGSSHVSVIPILPLAVESRCLDLYLKTCIALGF
jgi:hypothetical protein